MGVENLTANLGAAIDKIKMHKKYAIGQYFIDYKYQILLKIYLFFIVKDTFITDCVLYAPPSTEKFKVDLSRFKLIPEDEKADAQSDEKIKKQTEKKNSK